MAPSTPNAFGGVVKEAIDRAGGLRSLSRAIHKYGERVSPTQLSNLRDGLSPYDLRVVKAMASIYPDLAVRLQDTLGLTPAVPTESRLPLGPRISAMAGRELGDVFDGDYIDVPRHWLDEGATHTIIVDGDCLSPRLQTGDVVGLKLQDYARHGQTVLARVGKEYTLKRYSDTNGGHLERADGTPMAGDFTIVAVAVGVLGAL